MVYVVGKADEQMFHIEWSSVALHMCQKNQDLNDVSNSDTFLTILDLNCDKIGNLHSDSIL